MSDQPLSERTMAMAEGMHASVPGLRRPELDDFAHLDAAPAPAPGQDQDPPPEPPVAATWDPSAFDGLPDDVRSGVVAGVAKGLGRQLLEVESAGELVDASEVHRYITDPERFVGADGKVDRPGIAEAVADLVKRKPHLGKWGNGPGQVGARPDERRRAPAGSSMGARGTPPTAGAVESYRDQMAAAAGVKLAP